MGCRLLVVEQEVYRGSSKILLATFLGHPVEVFDQESILCYGVCAGSNHLSLPANCKDDGGVSRYGPLCVLSSAFC